MPLAIEDKPPVAKKPYRLVEHGGAYATLLQAAFDQICDTDDWRGPIDCMVPWTGASVYVDAIRFMTATEPRAVHTVQEGQSFARITSIGYRAGPAGS